MSEIPTRKRRRAPPGLQGPDKQIIQAATQEKRRNALELRKRKLTYDQIARAMGLSTPMVAWRYVQEALKEIPLEAAAEVKQLEIEDCRSDLFRLNERIMKEGGDMSVVNLTKALGAKVKLREQLARYLGLYAPVRTELTGKDGEPLQLMKADIEGMTDEQLERVLSGASGRGPGLRGGGAGASAEAPGADRETH